VATAVNQWEDVDTALTKTNTMEQTAVELLVEQLFKTNNNTTDSKKMDSESIIQQAKEMEEIQDSKRLLFAYKVSLIIGLEKTGELLKEVEKEIKHGI
jgi:hypothetical protein